MIRFAVVREWEHAMARACLLRQWEVLAWLREAWEEYCGEERAS